MPGISATINVETPILTIGATSVVDIDFNEAATGFDASDLILPGGSISNLASTDGGVTWTAIYTPQAAIQSAMNVIGLNLSSVMDSGGNPGVNLEVDSNNFIVDGIAPFINAITVQNTSLHAGDTTQVTFHFSEFVNGFAANQIAAPIGTISNLTTANNITWTATYTPNDNESSGPIQISASPQVTDFAGNAGGGSATSNTFSFDTVRPEAVVASVPAVVIDGTHPGTIDILFNEQVTSLPVGALMGNGTFSNVQQNTPVDYSVTFTPNAGIQSASQTISVDMTQVTAVSDGNAGEGTVTSGTFGVDTLGPTSTVTVGSGGPIAGTAAVSVHFSEAVSGFSSGLVTVQDGTVSNFTTADNQTFTGTFTVNGGVQESADQISVDNTGVTDAHGNAGTGAGTGTYAVDTVAPTLNSATVTDTAPHAGEADTVNIAFSEAVTGFTLGDITAQDATVSNLVDDGGGAFHVTLTPNDNVTAAGDTVTVASAGVQDLAGNAATGTVQSNSYDLDTIRPTAALHMATAVIGGGATSAFTVNFSEAVNGFDNSDLTVTGGTLSALTTADNIHYSGTFTPAADTFATGLSISLNDAGFTSVATGNAGAGTTASNSFSVETAPPEVSQIQTANVPIGQAMFHVIFDEPVQSFPLGAITSDADGTFLFTETSGDHSNWTVQFAPNAGVTQTGADFTIDMSQVVDFAGNHGAGTQTSNPFDIDQTRPTAVSLNVGASTFHAGDTSPITLTFSEPVQSVSLSSFGSGTGQAFSISGLHTTDGGTTWVGTFTPPANLLEANENVTFNVNDVQDLAGNQGNSGEIASNPYFDETLVPTATIGLSSDHVGTGGNLTLTINVNDPHVVPTFQLAAQDADITGLTQTGSTTYQATLIPHDAANDPTDMITLTGLDNTFNVNPNPIVSGAFDLDTNAPGGAIDIDHTTLGAGQTAVASFHFTEAVTDLTLGDITAQHATLSNLATADGGVDWTSTLTPAANDASDIASVSLDLSLVHDGGGNPGSGVVASQDVQIDTLRPTATIDADVSSLHPDQVINFTVHFSQAVTGFDNADLTAPDGTLSTVQTADGGLTWTTQFLAGQSLETGDHLSLNLGGVQNADGNAGLGTVQSSAYDIVSNAPPAPPEPPEPPPSQPTAGPETMTGTEGADTLAGGTDSDMVIGGGGDDSMSGQGGADTLSGGDGNDFLQGNVGTDSVNGGAGDDKVYGGQGDDIVQGGTGNDFVSGDKGDDVVRGGQGDDSVAGGEGNDFLSGDLGSDTMTGGPGADTFHSFAGAGLDVVTDFNLAEGDRVELDPGTAFTTAQVGADTVITLSGAGGTGELVLQGVQLSSLHGDWIFVG